MMVTPALLRRRLGVSLPAPGAGPLVLFVRVPAWIGRTERHPENCVPPLDLGICVRLAQDYGYRAFILDLETGAIGLSDVHSCLRHDLPRVLVLSGVTSAHAHMMALARTARSLLPHCLILACGQHADAVPEAFLFPGSPVDLCLRGEFEETLAEVLQNHRVAADVRVLGTSTFAGDAVEHHGTRPLTRPLDRLPMPHQEHFRSGRYRYLHPLRAMGPFRWGFLQSSRGCPFPCIYCSRTLRNSFGRPFRGRSAQSVVEEMRYLVRLGANGLVFLDDVFNFHRERALELCEAIQRAGLRIPWKAEGRVTPVDMDLLKAMRAAGCTTFSMGIESGSQRILDLLRKETTVEEIEEAFARCQEAGLIRVGFFMVGSPTETAADFEMTRALLRRVDPDLIQVAHFTCYPGSAAYDQYHREGPLRWEEYQHYETFQNLTAEDDDTVRRWQGTLYRDFLLRPSYVWRHIRIRHINLLLNWPTEWYLARRALRILWGRRRGVEHV